MLQGTTSPLQFIRYKGVIDKQCEQFLEFYPLRPPLWTILLDKTYVVICTFGYPLPCPHGLWMPPKCGMRISTSSVVVFLGTNLQHSFSVVLQSVVET